MVTSNISYSSGSVVIDYLVQFLIATSKDNLTEAEDELRSRLIKQPQGFFLKNLQIDENAIIIGRNRSNEDTESESESWKIIVASVMSVLGVILIVVLSLLLGYYCGWCRKSSQSSDDSWSDTQSFRPFTSAPYDKKRHWQDAPSLSSASSRSAFSRGSSTQQREDQVNEPSTVDWSVLRGFMKKNEQKATGLHRNMGPNTWVSSYSRIYI